MPSPRWNLWGTLRITPFRFPFLLRSNPVQQHPVGTEVEVCVAYPSQAQVGEVGTWQGIAPHIQAADLFVAGLAKARPQGAGGNRRCGTVGDEIDFVHAPGVA